MTLSSMLAQEEFEFITIAAKVETLEARLSLDKLGSPFSYPHGDYQDWDASLERRDASEIFGPAFPPAFALPDLQSTVAILAQSVFQDYW